MEFVQTEIRQPYCMPVTISVPNDWHGLVERRRRIAELKTKARGDEAAQVLLELAENELQQLIHQCGFNLWRRDVLRQELQKATDGPTTLRAYLPGERPIRSRVELLMDLVACTDWLVAFSGDVDMGQEAAKLQEQLEAAYQNKGQP